MRVSLSVSGSGVRSGQGRRGPGGSVYSRPDWGRDVWSLGRQCRADSSGAERGCKCIYYYLSQKIKPQDGGKERIMNRSNRCAIEKRMLKSYIVLVAARKYLLDDTQTGRINRVQERKDLEVNLWRDSEEGDFLLQERLPGSG